MVLPSTSLLPMSTWKATFILLRGQPPHFEYTGSLKSEKGKIGTKREDRDRADNRYTLFFYFTQSSKQTPQRVEHPLAQQSKTGSSVDAYASQASGNATAWGFRQKTAAFLDNMVGKERGSNHASLYDATL
jgi:hypothetical protein